MKRSIFLLCIMSLLTLSSQPLQANTQKEIKTTLTKMNTLSAHAIGAIKNLIKGIDGFVLGINGDKIKAMLVLRSHINNMLFGAVKNGVRQGLYLFDGEHYTIKELVAMEKEGLIDAQQYDTWLAHIKKDYAMKVVPFSEMARGNKENIARLVAESLKLHKRQRSILSLWAEAKEGNDAVVFERNITSFALLAEYLEDLMNFFDDLITSCPKACLQYINDNCKNDTEKKRFAQRFYQMYERQQAKIAQ